MSVRITMLLAEPSGPSTDDSEPMPAAVARDILVYGLSNGLRWDPGARMFDYDYGFPVTWALIVPDEARAELVA